MSRRSQVLREQSRLAHTPVIAGPMEVKQFANKQTPPARPQQVGLEQLVEMLIVNGAPRGYKVATSEVPPIVRLIATCGPLELPLDFTPDEARKLAGNLLAAAEKVDPQEEEEEEPVMTSPEAEALLAEFIDKAGPKCPGCERPLKGHELTNPDGTSIPDAYYCFPCMSVVQNGTLVQAPDTAADTSWIHGTAEPVPA